MALQEQRVRRFCVVSLFVQVVDLDIEVDYHTKVVREDTLGHKKTF